MSRWLVTYDFHPAGLGGSDDFFFFRETWVGGCVKGLGVGETYHGLLFFSIYRLPHAGWYATRIASPLPLTLTDIALLYASSIYLQQRQTIAASGYSTSHVKAFQMSTNVLYARKFRIIYYVLVRTYIHIINGVLYIVSPRN